MGTVYEKYMALPIDKGLLCLKPGTITIPYFCYSVNAEPIGFEDFICLILACGTANPVEPQFPADWRTGEQGRFWMKVGYWIIWKADLSLTGNDSWRKYASEHQKQIQQ